MQFFLGAICGVLLTVLATFIADTLTTANEQAGAPQTIVNCPRGGLCAVLRIEPV